MYLHISISACLYYHGLRHETCLTFIYTWRLKFYYLEYDPQRSYWKDIPQIRTEEQNEGINWRKKDNKHKATITKTLMIKNRKHERNKRKSSYDCVRVVFTTLKTSLGVLESDRIKFHLSGFIQGCNDFLISNISSVIVPSMIGLPFWFPCHNLGVTQLDGGYFQLASSLFATQSLYRGSFFSRWLCYLPLLQAISCLNHHLPLLVSNCLYFVLRLFCPWRYVVFFRPKLYHRCLSVSRSLNWLLLQKSATALTRL